MDFRKAARLSEYGAAVRAADAGLQYVFVDGDDPSPFADRDRREKFRAWRECLTRSWRCVDQNYAGVYKDWEPAKPKDIVTLLAELDDELPRLVVARRD